MAFRASGRERERMRIRPVEGAGRSVVFMRYDDGLLPLGVE